MVQTSRNHVILDMGCLSDVLAHARHTEKVVARSEEKVNKKKEKLGNRLQMAKLQNYEQKLQHNRGRGRMGAKDKDGLLSRITQR